MTATDRTAKTLKTLKKQIDSVGVSIPDHTIVRYTFFTFHYVAIYIAEVGMWYTSGTVGQTTFSHSEFIDVLSASSNVYLATDWELISAEPDENGVSYYKDEEEQCTEEEGSILDELLYLILGSLDT